MTVAVQRMTETVQGKPDSAFFEKPRFREERGNAQKIEKWGGGLPICNATLAQ
jgi:hypothetical protein